MEMTMKILDRCLIVLCGQCGERSDNLTVASDGSRWCEDCLAEAG